MASEFQVTLKSVTVSFFEDMKVHTQIFLNNCKTQSSKLKNKTKTMVKVCIVHIVLCSSYLLYVLIFLSSEWGLRRVWPWDFADLQYKGLCWSTLVKITLMSEVRKHITSQPQSHSSSLFLLNL